MISHQLFMIPTQIPWCPEGELRDPKGRVSAIADRTYPYTEDGLRTQKDYKDIYTIVKRLLYLHFSTKYSFHIPPRPLLICLKSGKHALLRSEQ